MSKTIFLGPSGLSLVENPLDPPLYIVVSFYYLYIKNFIVNSAALRVKLTGFCSFVHCMNCDACRKDILFPLSQGWGICTHLFPPQLRIFRGVERLIGMLGIDGSISHVFIGGLFVGCDVIGFEVSIIM